MAAQFVLKIEIIFTLWFRRNLFQSFVKVKWVKAETSPTNALENIEALLLIL